MSEQVRMSAIVNQIIGRLSQNLDASSSRRDLANLRSSLGKDLGQASNIWPLIFEHVPEKFLSWDGISTYAENAIINALQLFALHQQGRNSSVQLENVEEGHRRNLGDSLKILRAAEHKTAIDRRFNIMITSSSYEELIYHLSHMIRLLRRETEARVDYGLLSDDLFWFQMGKQEQVRLRWAQSYYHLDKQEKTEENKNE